MLSCLSGVFIISLITVTLMNKLEMTDAQVSAFEAILTREEQSKMEVFAANSIQKFYYYMMAKRRMGAKLKQVGRTNIWDFQDKLACYENMKDEIQRFQQKKREIMSLASPSDRDVLNRMSKATDTNLDTLKQNFSTHFTAKALDSLTVATT